MRVVKQAVLHFQEGKSDKVYEVDLCEVGDGKFVVNFRYGRRGAKLRDGSKTTLPVDRAKADKVYDDLVASKIKKGYRHAEASPPPPTPRISSAPPAEPSGPSFGPREQAVVARIEAGESSDSEWPLYRAIWRAAELDIKEAEDAILAVASTRSFVAEHRLRYTVCWALARCGSAKSIELLRKIYHDTGEKRFVRLIAAHGLKRLYGAQDMRAFQSALAETLPDELAVHAKDGPATRVMDELRSLVSESREHLDHVPILYLIGNEHTRPAVLEFVRAAPMEVDYFPQLRSLFKAAELHRDAELYGLLTYRFETTRGNHHDRSWYRPDYNPDSPEPYGEVTRIHFRRRAWRTLRRFGELGSPDYVKLAVGMLLPYTDDDGNQRRSSVTYDWDYNRHYRHWDDYSGYWSLCGILYGRSPRYAKDPAGKAWRCAGEYKPGDPAPDSREESFPELWDRMPQGLLHLLDESECRVVHEFAARAALANTQFLAELDAEVAIMLLGKRYPAMASPTMAVAG